MRAQLLILAAALSAWTIQAEAQGLSARFGQIRAVEREPLSVELELEDPGCSRPPPSPCLLAAVRSVVVEWRRAGGTEWQSRRAAPAGIGRYAVVFSGEALPARAGLEAESIEVRARVIGARGGLLLDLGGDADGPLQVEIRTVPEASADEKILGRRRDSDDALEGDPPALVGWVGAEGRAGSSARVRASVGLGLALGPRVELGAHVAAGPVFARPSLLATGGPVVLGLEAAVRLFARDVRERLIAPFLEPFACADLRLPGVDPGLGLRAGLTWNASADVALDAAIGGAFVVFRALDPAGRSSIGGVSGGLRAGLRFGGGR